MSFAWQGEPSCRPVQRDVYKRQDRRGCLAFYTLRESEEHILEDKQHGEHIHQRADLLLLGLAGDDIQQGPGDDTDGDVYKRQIFISP